MSFPDDVPLLTDGVVTLRAHRPDDVFAVLEQCTDPLSQRWTTVPVPYSRADAVRFVTEVVPSEWGRGRWAFAVEAPDHGVPRYCGTVELRDDGGHRAEIAYGAHPWARGRGLVQRALRLLLAWGFDVQGVRTVVWWANAGNWASRRTAWKLGFSCDGTVRGYLPQRGELLDGWVGTLRAGEPRSPRTEWLTVPVVEGERVRLRPLSEDDVPRIVEACADPRTAHWLSRVPRPFSEVHARAWLAGCLEQLAIGAAVTWATADPGTDALLGCVNAFDIAPRRAAEIGFWTHPDARGRGVTTEACGLVVRHCLTPYDRGGLGLLRVRMTAAEGNLASQHVIERNGFTLVGRERHALPLGDGSLVDLNCYDRLLDEPPSRGSPAPR